MSAEEQEHQSEKRLEAFRAIGRYVVVFSHLVSEMRAGIEHRLRGEDPMIARLALGEAYAAQIANSFFAICEREADLDEEERQVGVSLRNEVHAVIKERNDIAHGDWRIDWWNASAARLRRTKPGRRSGAWVEQVRPAHELEALTDEMETLTERVVEFAWLCFGIHPLKTIKGMDVRVRDIYRFQKHKGALRKGRYVGVLVWDDDDGDSPMPRLGSD